MITNSSVTLSPAPVSGTDTVSVSSDGYTLTLTLGGNLQASTTYTINVAGGAFTDLDGNGVSAFSSSFTTGTSVEASNFHGTIAMTNPAPGAAGIAITSAITATFSQPLNPNSLNASTFQVYQSNNGNLQISGTVTNPTPNTLVFTPAVALPPSATINVYVGYNSNITDYAGNYFTSLSGGSNAVFTTASTVDNTPPQVISMSPGNGATNVGPYAGVSLTFNKSLNVNTINASNFAMYYGTTFVNPTIGYSTDHRTVTLSTTLPYNTTVEVAVNTGVQDYAGNNMANAYQATFTTLPSQPTSAPSVIQARPGSGAPVTTPITFFTSAPMNLSTVQAGMYVVQNGVLITGTPTLTADLRGITWTPNSSFLPGALVEAYLTSTATDTSGNPATAYKLSFTTQAAAAAGAPTEVSEYPGRYNSVYTTNTLVEIQFSKPLNPATVTSTTFKVTTGSGPGGTMIPGALTLLNNNTIARFTPTSPFPLSAYFYVTLTTGIQDVAGDAFAGDGYYEYVQASAVLDNTPPTVAAVTPFSTSTSVGDNAPVRLLFSKVIDTSTINSSSVTLLNGATQIPWTASFGTINTPSQTVATLTPLVPLPDSSTITIQLTPGVTDLTGASISAQSPTFTTMAGADFSAPYIVAQSINGNNNTLVPTNTTFTYVFNKPLDPSTVIANTTGSNTSGLYIYDSANCGSACYPKINANVSSDGRTLTIIPQANLTPNATNDHVYLYNFTDLNGNSYGGTQQAFTTAATTNTTGPTILATNPVTNISVPVPTNTAIEVVFSAPVSGTSFGNITLTAGGSVPISVGFDSQYYTDDTVIRIYPQSLLLPNTTYTVNVTGVTDVAGNAAATTTFAFTTGPNYIDASLVFQSATVTTGSGTVALPQNTTVPNVLDSPTITITFDHAAEYAGLLQKYGGISLRNTSNTLVAGVTLNIALSSDQKTVTITTSGLAAATTYHLWISTGVSVPLDIAGTTYSSSVELPFTTQ